MLIMFVLTGSLIRAKPDTKMFKDVTRFCNLRYWVRTWVQVGQKLIKTKNL